MKRRRTGRHLEGVQQLVPGGGRWVGFGIGGSQVRVGGDGVGQRREQAVRRISRSVGAGTGSVLVAPPWLPRWEAEENGSPPERRQPDGTPRKSDGNRTRRRTPQAVGSSPDPVTPVCHSREELAGTRSRLRGAAVASAVGSGRERGQHDVDHNAVIRGSGMRRLPRQSPPGARPVGPRHEAEENGLSPGERPPVGLRWRGGGSAFGDGGTLPLYPEGRPCSCGAVIPHGSCWARATEQFVPYASPN